MFLKLRAKLTEPSKNAEFYFKFPRIYNLHEWIFNKSQNLIC